MADQQASGITERFGEWVKARRLQLHLTQAQVAERMRDAGVPIDPTGITRIEKGSRTLKIDEAQVLAECLWTTFARILEDIDSPPTVAADVANVLHQRREAILAWAEMEMERFRLAEKLAQYPDDRIPADVKLADLELALGPDSDAGAIMEQALFASVGYGVSEPLVENFVGPEWREGVYETFEKRDRRRREVFDQKIAGGEPYTRFGQQQMPYSIELLRRSNPLRREGRDVDE